VHLSPLTFGDRAFGAAGPGLWNSLPSHLKDANISYSEFRRSLKTFLFGQMGPRRSVKCFTAPTRNITYLLTYLQGCEFAPGFLPSHPPFSSHPSFLFYIPPPAALIQPGSLRRSVTHTAGTAATNAFWSKINACRDIWFLHKFICTAWIYYDHMQDIRLKQGMYRIQILRATLLSFPASSSVTFPPSLSCPVCAGGALSLRDWSQLQ